jgi:hypothetical protein
MENKLPSVVDNKPKGPPITEKLIEDYLFSSNITLNDQQKLFLLRVAIVNNLNPFLREVYVIHNGEYFNVVTGYQVYIKKAEATGALNGWNVETTSKEAVITIYKKNYEHPVIWRVIRSDFDKGFGSWKSMPCFTLMKFAIVQGFRLAFPEISGLPYLADEIEGVKGSFMNPKDRKVKTGDEGNPDRKSVKQLYKMALDLSSGDRKRLTQACQKQGQNLFIDLTIPQAYKVLDELRKTKKY